MCCSCAGEKVVELLGLISNPQFVYLYFRATMHEWFIEHSWHSELLTLCCSSVSCSFYFCSPDWWWRARTHTCTHASRAHVRDACVCDIYIYIHELSNRNAFIYLSACSSSRMMRYARCRWWTKTMVVWSKTINSSYNVIFSVKCAVVFGHDYEWVSERVSETLYILMHAGATMQCIHCRHACHIYTCKHIYMYAYMQSQ
jgi:hypothetical protein